MSAPAPYLSPCPDMDLATRDSSLPGLKYLLSDDHLSAALGERVHITRVRYKPGTSALAAFRRTRAGVDEYGWAMTRTAEGNGSLQSRAEHSRARGGSILLLRPDPSRPDALIAAGDLKDDHRLRNNLHWLRARGTERFGADRPNVAVSVPPTILRYNPERRVVALFPSPSPAVVKTAAVAYDPARRRLLGLEMHRAGVPVLPELVGPEFARHGISASPAWGEGDLSTTGTPDAAGSAGQALAALHAADTRLVGDIGVAFRGLARQLTDTRHMIAALLPGLEEPAARLADRILTRLAQPDGPTVPVLVHGDFSADQVLVQGTDIRLIDFDRVRTDEAACDLGSFAAVEAILGRESGGGARNAHTGALRDGYCQAGGQAQQSRVDAWAAARLFTGSVDPFRNRAADWAADTSWHLERAKELTS